MDVQVNLLAVLLAMVSSMVVGAVWYSMGVFGKRWVKLAKVDIADKKGADAYMPLLATAIVSLITAYVLANFIFVMNQFFGNDFLYDALITSFLAWLGFTAARIVTHDSFEGRPSQLTLITLGNEFVTIMVMGLVIGLMGV